MVLTQKKLVQRQTNSISSNAKKRDQYNLEHMLSSKLKYSFSALGLIRHLIQINNIIILDVSEMFTIQSNIIVLWIFRSFTKLYELSRQKHLNIRSTTTITVEVVWPTTMTKATIEVVWPTSRPRIHLKWCGLQPRQRLLLKWCELRPQPKLYLKLCGQQPRPMLQFKCCGLQPRPRLQ